MTSALVFVDTNVLVYAHDANAEAKQAAAAGLLTSLWNSRRGRISAQVLAELHAVLLRKFGLPLDVVATVGRSYRVWCAVDTTPALIEQAVEQMRHYRLSFFDSLIVAAGLTSGATVLLSEDFATGQEYHGMHTVNPFSPGFSARDLGLAAVP